MLQQEPSSQETLTSAQRRVTPEEVTQAIAALEAKKADESHIKPDTVTLGEVVNSLCLDATPDELWVEIQRQRNSQKLSEDEPQPVISLDNLPRTRFPSEAEVFRPLILSMALIILAFFGLCLFFPTPSQNGSPPDATYQIMPAPPNPNTSNQGVLVTDITSQGPVTMPLSSVPDNHPVFCTYDQASTITPGFLAGSFAEDSEVWRIVKHHGRVYLQGWIRNRRSLASLETTAFDLANKPAAEGMGPHPVMLSLPLGQFQGEVFVTGQRPEDASSYEKMHVSDAHPDAQIWDMR